MNDQHNHAGYDPYTGQPEGSFTPDPFPGALPGAPGGPYEPQYGVQWDSGAYPTVGHHGYGVPQYDATVQWTAVHQEPAVFPGQADAEATGQWDAASWQQAQESQLHGTEHPGYDPSGHAPTAAFDASQLQTAPYGYEATAVWAAPSFDGDGQDTAVWNSVQDTLLAAAVPQQFVPESGSGPESPYGYGTNEEYAAGGQYDGAVQDNGASNDTADHSAPDGRYDAGDGRYGQDAPYEAATVRKREPEPEHGFGTEAETGPADGPGAAVRAEHIPDHMAETMTAPVVIADIASHPAVRTGGSGSRGRRRTPAKRSALLTIAVPSACVMGVAGIAAASVSGLSGAEESQEDAKPLAAPDPGSVKVAAAANSKLDTQLAALSADARDFGDRASRTQERIDLKARQEADKKKREEEAARREALRPKFVLPVSRHGLSAYFGQAGVNWMSVHTGIDFPVSYGTPVMAATDGTVRTQWNSAYGNMAIVTSPDGTETWYCHLSSTRIRSGSVKAGDVIAYSGNSGNSTGPHLHFEVRPGAGAAIDPLPWLRSHGLEPT